ncbi:MAG TPA: methionyl-tRNA formyltransferase [Dissulfurispiraceae bacterium]|nr:methionyl-tRNA formyltransferase [Dissulfurispiraceae bacterium]
MAIVFFGTPDFAVPSLQALIEADEQIELVVTQPDRVKGRGHQLSAPPVKELALKHSLRIEQPENIRNSEFYGRLAALSPEFIIVVAYGKILPKDILDLPFRGCVNVHASLLPKFRGAAPIQWALLKGERITGVTTMLMDEGLDTGDILLKSTVDIGEDDTSAALFVKLAGLGAKTLLETIRGVRKGDVLPTPQEGEPSYAPPLKKKDGRIDWNRSAEELSFFVRGMNPWPSAVCMLGQERIKIIRAIAVIGSGVPGRIEKASGGVLLVGTSEGLLKVEEIQPEGKKVMPAAAFLAGRKLRERDEKFS